MARDDLEIQGNALRWCCDEDWLEFESTREVEPITGVVGQDDALEALKFGLEIGSPGQNVFVRGLTGTGRLTLVRQLMQQIRPAAPPAPDRCYVHRFDQPDRPRLITLPRGEGRRFADRMERFIEFVGEELEPALSADPMRRRRDELNERVQGEVRELGKPFEEELRTHDLALVPVQVGPTVQPAVMPVIDGEPAPPERFAELRRSGRITPEAASQIQEMIASFNKRLQEVSEKIEEIQLEHRLAVQLLYEQEARRLLSREAGKIEAEFPHDPVKAFLEQAVSDVVEKRLRELKEDDGEFLRLYRVNVVQDHPAGDGSPFIIENAPTLQNLLGSVEREFQSPMEVRSDHLMIRAGSLLRADGGYLIMEARDVLTEPGAWKVLVRTLRNGKLEIVPSELASFWMGPVLKPEPIEIRVKVVLLGDPELYYLLDRHDHDFPHLFKVLADFDTSIPRDRQGVNYYAGVLARIAEEENLLPFSRCGVAALCEHGARIAARRDRLTTRFGRIADVAREASHLARQGEHDLVTGDRVREAVRLSKRRADLPSRKFRKLVAEGTIRIHTAGSAVGQVNGLAVIHAGPMVYGFPTRITATIGPGTAGAINIERESQLSGAIHTKGFYILGGLLRQLLRTRHPLAFSASIAFEQSYGGIDGDSASGAEVCCLLSALTGVPLRQDVAMTGAIDQVGHVQPVGAVTEKVEGFFDTCRDLGLTGSQGVILPRANAGDLMLREDVVDACRQGRFHVWAVESIHEALEILTGVEAGALGEDGRYPANTLLGRAERKAREFWRMAAARPRDAAAAAESKEEAEG